MSFARRLFVFREAFGALVSCATFSFPLTRFVGSAERGMSYSSASSIASIGPFPLPLAKDLPRLCPFVDPRGSGQFASSSGSLGDFARDERVERRKTSDVSFSLAIEIVDVVRLRFAWRGGAGRKPVVNRPRNVTQNFRTGQKYACRFGRPLYSWLHTARLCGSEIWILLAHIFCFL
jgi:hypothetical protein